MAVKDWRKNWRRLVACIAEGKPDTMMSAAVIMEKIIVHAKFHAGHRQIGYPGKCRFVHGHTWHGSITIRAEAFPRDEIDMSLDFGDLKKHDVFAATGDPGALEAFRPGAAKTKVKPIEDYEQIVIE